MVGKHLLELFALLTFFTLGSLAQSASLIDVLRLEGFTAFADFLIRTNTSLPAGSDGDLIVYAPTNAALVRSLAAPSIRKRGVDEEEVAGSYQIAQNNKVVTNTPKRDYHDGSGTCSAVSGPGAVDFMTFLDDPEWVNLPPNNNASIVQKNTPKGALPVVFSGLGESVKVTGLDIAFDKGVIRPVSGMFTLPHLLSATLPFLGNDKVLAALQSTGLLNELDNIRGITFLAPDDRAIPAGLPNEVLADVLRQHTLLGPPIFTSDLQNGATYQTLAGTTVTVTVQCGDVFINGARILAGDAIIKNGVVHTVDKVSLPMPIVMTQKPNNLDTSCLTPPAS